MSQSFLQRLQVEFPDLFVWARWSYQSSGELRFGQDYISSTASVQQGDPLGPLLFSLLLSSFRRHDKIGTSVTFNFLFGILITAHSLVRESVSNFLGLMISQGIWSSTQPREMRYLWRYGDQLFCDFPLELIRSGSSCNAGIWSSWAHRYLALTNTLQNFLGRKWTKIWRHRNCFFHK